MQKIRILLNLKCHKIELLFKQMIPSGYRTPSPRELHLLDINSLLSHFL